MQSIGKLDRRITIRSRTLSQAPSGQLAEVYADLAQVWAAVNPVGALGRRDEQQAGMMVSTRNTEFVIRFRPGIVPDMEVRFNSEIYRINQVEEFAFKDTFFRNRYLRLRTEWRDDVNSNHTSQP